MSESASHQRAKRRAVRAGGRTECPVRGRRRLDACNEGTAHEVERSGQRERIRAAVGRLRGSGRPRKVLQVPDRDVGLAVEIMRDSCVPGTVKNMSGTRRRRVPPCR